MSRSAVGLDLKPIAVQAPADGRGRFSSDARDVLLASGAAARVARCGATQFVTYASLNFTTLFLMREKGMTLNEIAVYYALLIGIGISAGMYVSGRLVDRFATRGKQAYAMVPAVGAGAGDSILHRLRVGADLATGHAVSDRPDVLQLLLSLARGGAGPGRSALRSERVLAGALLLLVMNLIGLGLGPTYLGAASDLLRDSHPTQFAADRLLHAGAVLRYRRRAVPGVGQEVAARNGVGWRQTLMSLGLRIIAWSAAALFAVPAAAQDPVVRAPAGAVKGEH